MDPTVSVLVDASRPALVGAGSRPVRVHEWRAARSDAPLVVLSHGTGGDATGLAWWASGLCDAGLDVVAIDHHGGTWVDGYAAEAFVWWWDRPLDVSFVLDAVEARGPVGVGGFSIGGWTAAALCGARVAADAYGALLSGNVAGPPTPEYPGLREELLSRYDAATVQDWAVRAAGDHRDPRVQAAFLLCPSLGPLVTDASLEGIDIPVSVRWTRGDDLAPPEQNGMRYARLIPGAVGRPVGSPTSGHYGFVLTDHDDPAAKADVVAHSTAFFGRSLGAGRGAP